jgi:3-hydroxymyristoyl/3-hydroxydecanoyl-(acyl carrier protein) dehydratase
VKASRPAAGALAADFLPHAAPFLLLDRIVALDDAFGVFTKAIAIDDPLVGASGALSPTLVVEAMAQGAGLILMIAEPDLTARGSAFLAAIDRCEILAPVRAGDVLTIEARIARRYGEMARVTGIARVGDATCARATLTLAFVATAAPS